MYSIVILINSYIIIIIDNIIVVIVIGRFNLTYPGMKRGAMYVALFVVTRVPAALDIFYYLFYYPKIYA